MLTNGERPSLHFTVSRSSERRTIFLGFTEERVLEGQHIRYLYNEDIEPPRVMAKYVESGLPAHEKVPCLADTTTRAGLRAYRERVKGSPT